MSKIGLEEVISNNRADLERCGVRGIDLDYLLDERVDHALAMRELEKVIDKELTRCVDVRAMVTEKQWSYYEVCDPEIKEMVTWRRAKRGLKDAFEKRVLVFYKEAEKRTNEERKKEKKS